jgi:hypothetical protein
MAQENEKEPDNNFAKGATVITIRADSAIVGRFSATDTVDWWAFDLDSTRMYHIISRADHLIGRYHSELFFQSDTTKDILRGNENDAGNGGRNGLSNSLNLRVCGFVPWKGSGRYYLKVSKGVPDETSPTPGRYVISVSGGRLLSVIGNLHEPDDTVATAQNQKRLPIDGTKLIGAIYPVDDVDMWRLEGVAGDSFYLRTEYLPDVHRRSFDSFLDLCDETGFPLGMIPSGGGFTHDGVSETLYYGDDDRPDRNRDILTTLKGKFPYTGTYYLMVTNYFNSGSRGYLAPRYASVQELISNQDDDPVNAEYGVTYRKTANVPVSVNDERPAIHRKYVLQQNYPNPFNPNTVIRYEVGTGNHVVLKVFDVLGREAATLVNEWKEAGNHSIIFDVRFRKRNHSPLGTLSSGVYFYTLQVGNQTTTKQMVVLR